MDTLVRIFMTTVLALVQAKQWDALQTYFALISRILSAPEGVIIPGQPQDKEP